MNNYFKIPLITPFKFVPATQTPGIHFDDDWACRQIKSFERKAAYRQKWVKAETTLIQIESTIAPQPITVYDVNVVMAKQLNWTVKFSTPDYAVYETIVDFSDLQEGVYFLYFSVALLAIKWPVLSEPIEVRTFWPNTLLFTYRNSFNDFDVAWSTGLTMKFRCEAAIMDFTPKGNRTSGVNQVHDYFTLSGVPSRLFKLYIAEAPGVPPYVIDILNRIFVCGFVDISGKQYQADGDFDITRIKGYPYIGASLDIVYRFNNMSLEFSDTTPPRRGIVIAYNIQTTFFGAGTVVPVTDIETQ